MTPDRPITQVDFSGNHNISLGVASRLLDLYPNVASLTLLHSSSKKIPLVSLHKILAARDGGNIELHHSKLNSAFLISALSPPNRGRLSNALFQGPLSSLPSYHYAPGGTADQVVFLSITMKDGVPKPSERWPAVECPAPGERIRALSRRIAFLPS